MNDDRKNSPTKRCRVSVIAIMPGRKTGMTLMTQRIVDDMQNFMDVRLYDIGGYTKANFLGRIFKATRSILSGLKLLTWRANPGECLYVPINSQAGLLYNVWQFLIGRLRGFQIVAHHHGWSYLYSFDRRMDWLIRAAGPRGVHVVACPEMLRDLRKMYARPFEAAFVTPGIVGPKTASADLRRKPPGMNSRRFRLGMLSNLMATKGVAEAINTLECCLDNSIDAELHLAGPICDSESSALIEQAKVKFGDRLTHIGPVYNDAKDQFYLSLDAFLFPTRYRNESWGIVLNEALMAGVPVATYRRGCTAYLVADAGLVVEESESFAQLAMKRIKAWIEDPTAYEMARIAAAHRGVELKAEAERQLKLFLTAFETKDWPPLPPLGETHCCTMPAALTNSGERISLP